MGDLWMKIKILFQNILDKVFRITDRIKDFLCLMMLFNSSIIGLFYLQADSSAPVKALIEAIGHFLTSFSMIYITAAVIRYLPGCIFKVFLERCFIIIAIITCTVDWFLLYQYGDVLDQTKLAIILSTDPGTAWEFLRAYVLHVKVILALVCFLSLFAYTIHKIRHIGLNPKLSIFILICFLCSFAKMGYIAKESICDDIDYSWEITHWKYDTLYKYWDVARFCMDFYAARMELGGDDIICAGMDKAKESQIVEAGDMQVPYVVFVLGESTDRNHMGLYGYDLPTSPLLEAREKQGELAVFDDTIACGNGTTQAMSMIFNTAPKDRDSSDPWYEYLNLIDTIRMAGYHTTWLSNQEPSSGWGNLEGVYAHRSDELKFMRITGGIKGGGFVAAQPDEQLLPYLDEFLQDNHQPRQYYTIHLYGTHEIFSSRYTDKFAKFTADDEEGDSKGEKQTKAEYDNAVLYNDYIVNEIIRRFEDKNAIIFYISDHGMDLYDTSKNAQHTAEEKRSKHMIEIPFVVWTSKQYREQYPEVWQRIKNGVHRPYRTDYLMYSIFDAIGVNFSDNKTSKSIFSNDFEPFDRIYGGEIYSH